MKASADRESLLSLITACAAATADDPYLRIVAQQHSLACEAVSAEIGAHVRIPAGVEREGAIAVPARTLSRLAARLPEGTVELEAEHPRLHLRFEGGSASLLAADPLAVADFPQFPQEMAQAPDLDVLLGQVAFACAGDNDGRPQLRGIHLRGQGGRLYAIASDGCRLAMASLPYQGDGSCTISRRTASLLRELSRKERDGHMAILPGRLYYETASARTTAAAIAYPYPDIWQLREGLPRGTTATLPREQLTAAVAMAAAILTQRPACISLALTRRGLTVGASSDEGSLHHLVSPAGSIEGPERSCLLQADYLLRPLRALPRGVERVQLAIAGARQPLVLSAREGDLWVEHVIMPFVTSGQPDEGP